jgi:hypothetical protein
MQAEDITVVRGAVLVLYGRDLRVLCWVRRSACDCVFELDL